MTGRPEPSRREVVIADIMLFFASVIWGFGFVAQSVGMEYMGPYMFTALRFTIGGLALIPVAMLIMRRAGERIVIDRALLVGGVQGGLLLALAATAQQVGMLYTSAGNAGFITGLYVIMIPIFGCFIGRRAGRGVWLGAAIAVSGIFVLSGKQDASFMIGDLLIFICAVLWAFYFMVVGERVRKSSPLPLAVVMFLFCGLVSFIPALIFDELSYAALLGGSKALGYSAFLSVAVAFTLQVAAQKKTKATHAGLLSSLEGVFAVIGGVLMLGEPMTSRRVLGCVLMFIGVLVAELWRERSRGQPAESCVY